MSEHPQTFSTDRMLCVFFFCIVFVQAAGKIAREEGKHDLGSTPEDSFPDNLSLPPSAAELVSNPHSSRSELGPRTGSASPPHTLFIRRKPELLGCSQPSCMCSS